MTAVTDHRPSAGAIPDPAELVARVTELHPLWRDSSVAARHAVVLPVIGYEIYGKALLGRDDHITPLV